MTKINITVVGKVAYSTDDVSVCGNSDYVIEFNFSEEWNAYDAKTARFVYCGKFVDVPFVGNTVNAPIITNATIVEIGVYAGDLHTTTGAKMSCKKSILCGDPTHEEPPEDIYNQLLEVIKTMSGGNAPYIGDNGNWYIYDVETRQYKDSGTAASGKDGAKGADGHTPEKGVDYFTEAEKAEIVNDVINALPEGDEVNY